MRSSHRPGVNGIRFAQADRELIFPDWTGETVAVVAGGESARILAPQLAGRCRTIVVNLAYKLLPQADILYAADSGFWLNYRDAHAFTGLKVAASAHAQLHCRSLHVVDVVYDNRGRRVEHLQEGPLGCLGSGGGNGGFQAFNLALQLIRWRGTVLLAGLDYRGNHWHKDHPAALRNPSVHQLKRWRERFESQAAMLRNHDVRVINLSQQSSLKAFPYGTPDCHLPGQGPAALSP